MLVQLGQWISVKVLKHLDTTQHPQEAQRFNAQLITTVQRVQQDRDLVLLGTTALQELKTLENSLVLLESMVKLFY